MPKPAERNVSATSEKATVNERLALFASILDSVTMHSVVAEDFAGAILSWNTGARSIYGYESKEMVGKQNCRLLHAPEDLASGRVDKFLNTARQAGMAEQTFQCIRKNGERFSAAITAALRRDPGGTPIGLLSISKDVTNQQKHQQELEQRNKELEEHDRQAQEANRLRGEFLVSMSHRLRTPLNSIIGFAKMVFDGKAGPTTAVQREFLDDIVSSGRHLLQLINNVLDLAKIESGSVYFYPEPVNLNTIAAEVCEMFRVLAANRGIEIQKEIEGSLSSIVIDLTTIKQLLYNFLSNALELAVDGTHTLLRIQPEGAEHFIVEVEASGIGITIGDIRRLLQDFTEPKVSRIEQNQSTDISLALLKRIVEAQGGELGIRSTPGRVSIFWARLLRHFNLVEHDTVGTDKTVHAQKADICILVVDDDPSSLKLAERALAREGYRVLCAPDGEEGLKLIENENPAAIILDLVRNGIDGYEFLRRVRRGAGVQIPVIIWSGKTFTQEQRNRLLRNVNKIVPKGDGGIKEILEELKASHLAPIGPQG